MAPAVRKLLEAKANNRGLLRQILAEVLHDGPQRLAAKFVVLGRKARKQFANDILFRCARYDVIAHWELSNFVW